MSGYKSLISLWLEDLHMPENCHKTPLFLVNRENTEGDKKNSEGK